MSSAPDANVRAMHALCEEIKASIVRGDLPVESMADLKRAIDETRMWLWATMEAAQSDNATWVQEFWLFRTAEMCQNMVLRLEGGMIDRRSPRAGELRAIAARLATELASAGA